MDRVSTPSTALTDPEARVIRLLRRKGLSIKRLDDDQKQEVVTVIRGLHVDRGVSLNDIALLIGNKTSGYTSWLCRQLGIQARPFEVARLKGIREKRRKYERRPFNGTDEDKAYLLGLRHGDLSVSRPWKGVVRVSTSTTHPAMAELFTSLFRAHGHVYHYPRYKKDTKSFEWNLTAILDSTFDFLCEDLERSWSWVSSSQRTLVAFLAGLLDAEGHIGVSRSKNSTSVIISIYNTNRGLLERARSGLIALGYTALGPYLDKRKGSMTAKYGIERKRDYWRVALARFDECRSLLGCFPIRHPEKLGRKELVLALSDRRPWKEVLPNLQRLRDGIRTARDNFVDEARRAVEEREKRKTAARALSENQLATAV